MRQITVTTALSYSNGPLHLGHMLECIQADVWARFQRAQGHRCLLMGGEDAHGTPIMLSAQKAGISPETLIARIQQAHQQDLQDFHIHYDHYYTTHSPENRALCEKIYHQLSANGDISQQTIQQAFDPEAQLFLADRFIRGSCPRCHTADQYGDNCERCGATYSPSDLVDARSAISGATPIEKSSQHYFFELNRYQEQLKQWATQAHLPIQVANKLKEWLDEPLHAWDISRDAPYFGFTIPNDSEKYFYVWLDAPIGYLAIFQHFCQQHPDYRFEDDWGADSKTELYHFLGKDVMYFHALFWPAILMGVNLRLPTRLFVHGYVTINGEKMSKSRGTFITARDYLTQLDAEYLRYYFCAKLNAAVEDIDFNLNDFRQRCNADLVGKFVNLASRCAGFIHKHFEGKLAAYLDDEDLWRQFIEAKEDIAQSFETLNYNKAVRHIMALADKANQYIDQQKPWQLIKVSDKKTQAHAACTQGLNLFKVLATYLSPILPKTSEKIADFLNIATLNWQEIDKPLLDHRINAFQPLMQRIDEPQLSALIKHHEKSNAS